MAGDEPQLKKVKIHDDNEDDIFSSFHKKHLRDLELALGLINNEQSGYAVGIAKIRVCNAQSSKSFSSATCDCEELSTPSSSDGSTSIPEGFGLNGIFQYGIDMLESFVSSSECIPQRKGARMALEKLLTFLSDKGSAEKAFASEAESETEWTERIAHHLLSKLAVGSNYTLDSQCKRKSKDLKCSCGCGEKLLGNYGDTSLGVPLYWHGRLDILMDAAVATFPSEEPDSPGAANKSSIEVKSTKSDRMAASKEQIRAEAIVFSFLQKKNHPDLDNFLIPTIAMSKTQVAICLYDSQNDIFMETPRLDLFLEGRFLKIATVVTLWLALNYRYCCSGVPEEIIEINYKADFFKHIGSLLEKYSVDVKCPCDYQPSTGWLALPLYRRVNKKVNNVNQICRFSK